MNESGRTSDMDEDEDSDEEVPCRLRKEENEVLQDFKEETGDE